MRLAVYTLAALLIAGLAVGVSFSYTPSVKNESSRSDGREVYVDISKLSKLHPSYAALVEMRAALADVQAGSSRVVSLDHPELRVKKIAGNTPATIDRSNLVAAVAKSAMDDLYMLESDQREALRARLREKRETMMEDAEAEIKLQVYELEDETAKKLRLVTERYVTDRLNAQIRTFALKSASESLGVDQEAANLKLAKACAELDYIDSACLGQENEVNAKSKDQINTLRKSAERDIDAALSLYESTEDRRISDSVSAAREQTLRDLKLQSGVIKAGKAASASLLQSGGAVELLKHPVAEDNASAKALIMLEKQASEIELRIKEDVVRVVQKLASEKGVKVTFSRGERRLADETQMFRGLMRKFAWGICEPVLTGMSGS